ncbi:MAG: hypothetical protein ABIO92_10905 [Chloroflexia bacterium]
MSVARESRLIVGVQGAEVVEERSWEEMQSFAEELPASNRYCSDALSVYSELWWPSAPDGGNSRIAAT